MPWRKTSAFNTRARTARKLAHKLHAARGWGDLEADGALDLLAHQAHRDAQLRRAVLEQLLVVEVAREAHVPEDGLLEPQVGVVELAVDADRRDLRVDVGVVRLQPVDVRLVALHEHEQLVEPDRRLAAARDARLHDLEARHVDALHLCRADARSGAHCGLLCRLFFLRFRTP